MGSSAPRDDRTLRERQSLLVNCLGELFRYAISQGYELTLGEGYVRTPRKVIDSADVVVERADAEHMVGSLHNQRLAIDLNLFVQGRYVTDGEHHAWRDIGTFWESLDPLCRWGGRFRDANHLSVTDGSRA